MDDWKNELLQGTWPAEERFDCWKDYTVIAIGSKYFQQQVYSTFNQRGQTPLI
jgi:hypothetical protein